MLEWMHDQSVVEYMKADFANKTIQDCENFILESQKDVNNKHFAIVDDINDYMGTVSLKDISENTAEFAIAIRKKAMGLGYSAFGMREIIKYGFEELNLDSIFWYVSRLNIRAIKFYDKNGYARESETEEYISYRVYKQGKCVERQEKLKYLH